MRRRRRRDQQQEWTSTSRNHIKMSATLFFYTSMKSNWWGFYLHQAKCPDEHETRIIMNYTENKTLCRFLVFFIVSQSLHSLNAMRKREEKKAQRISCRRFPQMCFPLDNSSCCFGHIIHIYSSQPSNIQQHHRSKNDRREIKINSITLCLDMCAREWRGVACWIRYLTLKNSNRAKWNGNNHGMNEEIKKNCWAKRISILCCESSEKFCVCVEVITFFPLSCSNFFFCHHCKLYVLVALSVCRRLSFWKHDIAAISCNDEESSELWWWWWWLRQKMNWGIAGSSMFHPYPSRECEIVIVLIWWIDRIRRRGHDKHKCFLCCHLTWSWEKRTFFFDFSSLDLTLRRDILSMRKKIHRLFNLL